jgi:hypothetical protein
MRNKMFFAAFSVIVILAVAVSPVGQSRTVNWMGMAIPMWA